MQIVRCQFEPAVTTALAQQFVQLRVPLDHALVQGGEIPHTSGIRFAEGLPNVSVTVHRVSISTPPNDLL